MSHELALPVSHEQAPTQQALNENSWDADDTCAICLNGISDRVTLGCGHPFCSSCLSDAVAHTLGQKKRPQCSLCAAPMQCGDVEVLRDEVRELAIAAVGLAAPDPPPRPTANQPTPHNQRAEESFRAFLQNNHVHACPSCHVPIEKNGGCPRMRCSQCNHSFVWNSAPLACPCKGFHVVYDRDTFNFRYARMPTAKRCIVPGAPMPDAEFARLKRGLRTGAICVAVALLPVHIPLAVLSGIINVPSAIYGLNGTCAERCCRRAVATNYKQQRKIVDACGRRRPHEFVSGWCQICGATEQEPRRAQARAPAL